MQKLYKIVQFISLCSLILLIIIWNINWNEYNTEIQEPIPSLYNISDLNVGSDKLFNLQFEYILKSDVCENTTNKLFAIIIVTSYFSNTETRNYMRQAFSNLDLMKLKLRRVFLLGLERNNITIPQSSIKNESEHFGDIIQGNFMEAYRNLTYKHVMGLKWASHNCRNVKYVIKMDDDVVVDLRLLITQLKNIRLPSQNYIIGNDMTVSLPIRDTSNKWYVTLEEFKDEIYPPFVSGWLYATTPQAALHLSLAANKFKYFWIDDVFVTGIVAEKLKFHILNIENYFTYEVDPLKCCLIKSIYPCNYWIGPNDGQVDMFYKFNMFTSKCLSTNACKKYTNEVCSIEEINTIDIETALKRLGTGRPIISPHTLGKSGIKVHIPNVF